MDSADQRPHSAPAPNIIHQAYTDTMGGGARPKSTPSAGMGAMGAMGPRESSESLQLSHLSNVSRFSNMSTIDTSQLNLSNFLANAGSINTPPTPSRARTPTPTPSLHSQHSQQDPSQDTQQEVQTASVEDEGFNLES